jgi:hypothetical protein
MYKYNITPDSFPKVHITCTNEHNNVIEKVQPFMCQEDAERFVNIDMRNWLAENLKRYVNHSSVLSAFGWRAFYNSVNRCEALDYAVSILGPIKEWDLFRICNWIIDNEDKLKLILPAPSNKSYASSELKMREMLWLSKNIRRHQREQLLKQQSI